MDELLYMLKKTELFRDFPDDVITQEILPRQQLQDYPKGRFLIEQQQRVERFSIVVSGKIHIMHLFPNGTYSLMSAVGAGEIVGADLICTRSQVSPYHAVAAIPTQVLAFPVELLTQPGMLQEPWRLTALNRLLTLISHENMKKEYRLAILSQKGLRERITTYLTMQSARLHTNTFSIPFSRDDLAAYLCVNRSALSHELSLMQQEGLIKFRKNVFTLTVPTGNGHK